MVRKRQLLVRPFSPSPSLYPTFSALGSCLAVNTEPRFPNFNTAIGKGGIPRPHNRFAASGHFLAQPQTRRGRGNSLPYPSRGRIAGQRPPRGRTSGDAPYARFPLSHTPRRLHRSGYLAWPIHLGRGLAAIPVLGDPRDAHRSHDILVGVRAAPPYTGVQVVLSFLRSQLHGQNHGAAPSRREP